MLSWLALVVISAEAPSPAPPKAQAGEAVTGGAFMRAPIRAGRRAATTASLTSSYNWSGYVQESVAGRIFTEVNDTFVIPTVETGATTPPGTQEAADWVGIGGFDLASPSTDSTLVQAGIESNVTTTTGQSTVTYDAWTETLPQTESALRLRVSAGDTVTVTVQEIAKNRWRMTVDDVTTGRSRSRTKKYHSSGLSAEAIHERPCLGAEASCQDGADLSSLAPTADVTFDPGSFSEALPGMPPVNQPLLNSVPEAALFQVAMVGDDDTTVIATPSGANTASDGFAVADGGAPPPAPNF